MKKTQIIGLGLILLFIFSGIIFIPKLIEPKEEPETFSYDKVEELDYWLVGKESKLNFVKEEVEEEQQVPETIIIPKEKKEVKTEQIHLETVLKKQETQKEQIIEQDNKKDLKTKILSLNAAGKSSIDIARELGISITEVQLALRLTPKE